MLNRLHYRLAGLMLGINSDTMYEFTHYGNYKLPVMRAYVKYRQHSNDLLLYRTQESSRYLFFSHKYDASEQYSPENEFRLISVSFMDELITADNDAFLKTKISLNPLLRSVNRMFYLQDSNRHYHLRKDGTVTFTPKNKPTLLNPDNQWRTDGRQVIKLGKAIRAIVKQFSMHINDDLDAHIATMTEIIHSKYNFTDSVTIVAGTQIPHYYHYSQNADIRELGNSCMRHDHCEPYIHFYAKNPERVQMLIATNSENKLTARALLWNAQIGDKEFKVMDRVYGRPVAVNYFHDWATANGYAYKTPNSYDTNGFIAPNGTQIPADSVIVPGMKTHTSYPYLDTFRWTDDDPDTNDVITLTCSYGTYYEFNDTGGSYSGCQRSCDFRGDSYPDDELRWSDYMDAYIHEDEAIYSNYMSDWLFQEDCIETYNGDWIHEDDSVNIIYKSSFFFYRGSEHMDNTHEIEIHGNWYTISNDKVSFDDNGQAFLAGTSYRGLAPTLANLESYTDDDKDEFEEYMRDLKCQFENAS